VLLVVPVLLLEELELVPAPVPVSMSAPAPAPVPPGIVVVGESSVLSVSSSVPGAGVVMVLFVSRSVLRPSSTPVAPVPAAPVPNAPESLRSAGASALLHAPSTAHDTIAAKTAETFIGFLSSETA